MKKKLVSVVAAVTVTASLLAGCAGAQQAETTPAPAPAPAEEETEAAAEPEEAEEPAEEEKSDQELADEVAALIDAIYVQEWTEETEAQCAAAKEGWDALTDAQKELVEGENADPDYFGRDTGDASKDDPLNQDDIGENELLVVSFGTSFNDSRTEDIGGIEKALAEANPDWAVRRAFTAQIIMNHVLARDGEKIDNMAQALDRAVENGVKNLVVQPTHLMHGAEYDELTGVLDEYRDQFETVVVAEPLLGEVGDDAETINDDKKAVAEAVTAEAVKTAGFDSLDDAEADGTAFVFMGHGTSHTANVTYDQMQAQMEDLGYKNVFIGTVEGEPEDTACDVVIEKVTEAGYKKVILRPLMVVAGDHANNDMAGDEEDSWKSMFEASGNFDSVDCQVEGLGRIEDVQKLYVAHTAAAMEGMDITAADPADKEAADEVAALIDAIYVQEWTEETDAQCEAAKKGWDALTDAQKELVEGENADPDYFGRDTGDASKDDPLNQDKIGENELLVVSFGTSFNDSRTEDIGGIEKALAKANPDWSVRRAFTAQIIMNHVQARDGEKIDNMTQALDRAVENGVKNLVVQPTHLMHGAEYDELTGVLDGYKDKFDSVVVAEPLLGEVGKDAKAINDDKKAVAEAVVAEAVKVAGFKSLDDAEADGTAFVFMGHGTSHTANVTYDQMQTQMEDLGYKNVFIGTVEGEPEDTACDVVIDKVKEAGYKKVILRPLMVVAGDHANNDMAGDEEDSWKSMFEASGNFDSVDCQVEGLGRIADIQKIYVAHTADAMGGGSAAASALSAAGEVPADGEYLADFKTDGSMFHVNEAKEGKGELTVKNGEMTIHISLPSKNVVNLFPGKAEDAQKKGAKLLQPTVDKVTYSDGKTEEVHGFDVPVPALGEEFDLALVGTKGKWYDHKVTVSNPEKK